MGVEIELRRHKYALLLALLLVAVAIETFNARGAGRLLSDILRTILSVTIWYVVFKRPRERAVMAALVVAFLATGWGRYLTAESHARALSLAEQTVVALSSGARCT